MKKNLIIIALGGNALLQNGQKGSVDEQRENIKKTLLSLMPLIREGHQLILTHGNGPQVGNVLLKNDAGEQLYNIPAIPLDAAVADTQGEIGYLIQSELYNLLKEEGINREIISINTMVEVDKNDSAFQNPTKRVGKTYYDYKEVEKLKNEKGWVFKEEVKNNQKGWRRVVPSPQPLDIANKKTIRLLANSGAIVIAVGGGGIPVSVKEGRIKPEEAVIDKDLASALLSEQIGADRFIILTDVPFVYLDYATPTQKELDIIDLNEIDKYMEQGKFGEGNMAPKIKAAKHFIEKGGKEVIITNQNGLANDYGTKIVLQKHPQKI
jgi:carbamate kinase